MVHRTYELQMVQNPIHARMCGFGEKDRRPMDPPPILKLVVRNTDGTLADVSQMDVNFYMVMADIYSADRTTPCTLVTNPAQGPVFNGPSLPAGDGGGRMSVMTLVSQNQMVSRNLTGSTVASGNLLSNLDNELGVYFVFQDISVRSEGTFTLKFSFTLPPAPDDPPSLITATTFSEPFTIYSAKKFPGMTESTALSRCFAKQGIKIPIRKEPRMGKSKQGSSAGLDSDSTTTTITPSVSYSGQIGQDNPGSDSDASERRI
ncbi:hypothetical protein EMPS_02240 [Entomortierella parvispora]|uniref:Velvet domain-containing protein n=1 Tax=Entomortierella parvispora TaxID=205924 RepID=A0A9P3H4B8_9FUNG|nr:hypothetical protein EMPS_02240 [Entomortierella parvispora]